MNSMEPGRTRLATGRVTDCVTGVGPAPVEFWLSAGARGDGPLAKRRASVRHRCPERPPLLGEYRSSYCQPASTSADCTDGLFRSARKVVAKLSEGLESAPSGSHSPQTGQLVDIGCLLL
jgi:hypothetical protein